MAKKQAVTSTPRTEQYTLPAEWEPHEATWIAWPLNSSDWPGKFTMIPWVYGEIVRKLAEGELVRIIVDSGKHKESARRVLQSIGVPIERVEFFRFPMNRGWTRDYGPFFVRRRIPQPGTAVVQFHFNGWAKYPDWKKDARIHERAAQALGKRLFRARSGSRDIVLEGGGIDGNGRGTLITTEECFLDQTTQVRNPGLSKREFESTLQEYLGVTNILWLGRGIAGDDTHGHVDDFCRFVGPKTVVLCAEENTRDANYAPLQENRERLSTMRLEDGSPIEVVPLPMPSPLLFKGQRLPASYANFYISNAAVLVPTFNDPRDRAALGILADLFTDRPVIGIHAVDLVWGLGTLHCLTHEEPSTPPS
jgi:agmatine deiminase